MKTNVADAGIMWWMTDVAKADPAETKAQLISRQRLQLSER
jgi:hypothetical protein